MMLRFAKRILRNRLAGFGAGLLLMVTGLCLVTPFLGLPDPNVISTAAVSYTHLTLPTRLMV